MKRMQTCGIAAVILGLAAMAQADNSLSPVAALINQKTISVVRIDLAAVHVDAIGQWLSQNIAASNLAAEDKEDAQAAFQGPLKEGSAWIASAGKSGVKTLWVVCTQEFEPDAPPTLFAELAPGADVPAILKLFGISTEPPTTRDAFYNKPRWVQIGDLLVMTDYGEDASAWKNIKSEPRPDLAKVFASAGPGTMQGASIPTAKLKKMMASAQLPDGRPMSAITDALVSMAMSVQSPPQMAIRLVVQCPDAASATNLLQSLNALIDAGKKMTAQTRPSHDPALDIVLDMASDYSKSIHVDGDKLVLDLQAQKLSSLASMIGMAAAQWQRALKTMISSSNLRQIMMGCIMYANENNGAFPKDLESLIKAESIQANILVNPAHPADKAGYIYINPKEGSNAPADRLVVYEKFDKFGKGINVGYADGHIEFVSDEAAFKKSLETAQQAAK